MRRLWLLIIAIIIALFALSCNGNTTLPTTDITTGSGTTLTTATTQTTVTSTQDGNLRIALNPGVDTVEVNTEFIDAGASAYYGDLELVVRGIENTVDISVVGAYYIKYLASYNELEIEIIRIVVVLDTTPPVAFLNPGIDTIKVGGTWFDAGVHGEDAYFGNFFVTVHGTVDTNTIGTYTITYVVYDELGNSTSIIRIVDVVD